MSRRRAGLSTLAIHGDAAPRSVAEPVAPPVYQSSTFVAPFGPADEVLYPRYGNNPNQLRVAERLGPMIAAELRVTVLGHIQRGGSPSNYDRVLAVRYGQAAAELAERGEFGRMVALRGGKITSVSIEEASAGNKRVDPAEQLVSTARAIGVCFGDEA